MSKNTYEEKESLGSRPNKKNKNDEWVEESFGDDHHNSSGRVRKKPSKKLKKK